MAIAETLKQLINSQATEDRQDEHIIKDMATAAGISSSTVQQILRGEIKCPPVSRLQGFAKVLKTSAAALMAAGNQSGCNYTKTKKSDESHGIILQK